MAPECHPYLTFGKQPHPCPEHVLASRESDSNPLSRSVIGGLETGSIGEEREGKKLGPGVRMGVVVACRPRIVKIQKSPQTPRSSPMKNDSNTHSRARKWLLTPALWSPLELSDPISDSVCKSPPLPPLQKGAIHLIVFFSQFLVVRAYKVSTA